MRILFISAFYPPHVIGGWEQLVQDINHGMLERGHITHVLTSVYGVNKPVQELGVDRLLTLESDLNHYKPAQFLMHGSKLKKNLKQVEAVINDFRPDVVFIHVMWNLSKGIPWIVEKLCPDRVVYYIANDWPYATDVHSAFWHDHAKNRFLNWAKQRMSPLPLWIVGREKKKYSLRFTQVMCVSQAIKDNLARYANIDPNRMRVVYNGVETNLFLPPEQGRFQSGGRLSLLYAGSLVTHKGVHTAIEALAILHEKGIYKEIELSIVGAGHPDYEAYLQGLVSEHHLNNKVHFLGRIPRNEMPALFQKYDVLVFPSVWEEPLARVMQEAMASGLVVVGTLTGGTGEVLIDGETGLTFSPGDANMLAAKIEQLYSDTSLCRKLSGKGRDKVLAEFDVERMMDEMEDYLADVVHGKVQTDPHVPGKPNL